MTEGIGAPAEGSLLDGKYRVGAPLGRGGMGCLVNAYHLLLKKPVAIKFVHPDRSDVVRQRLFQEARAAQLLSSEHVVRVFEVGVHDGAPFIVMERLTGHDLAERLRLAGPLTVPDAVDAILEACVAVAEAHARGIVHRDLKPANLFAARTDDREVVKVLDFGISKVPAPPGGEDASLTVDDAVLGTPSYSSPEQLRDPAKVDARTDVWSLGVTLFQLLSGQLPFPAATAREVTAAIFTDAPRSLLDACPTAPEALSRALAAALSKRPEDRTPSVREFVRAIAPFASKRGQLAAERVFANAPAGSPQLASDTAVHPADDALGTTEAGLSSAVHRNAARAGWRRHRVAAAGFWLGSIVIAGGVAAGSWRDLIPPAPAVDATGSPVEPTAASPTSAPVATMTALGEAAPKPSEAAPGLSAVAKVRGSGRSATRAPTSNGAVAGPSAPPSADGSAGAYDTAARSPAVPKTDVDGLPIIQ